MAGRFSQTEEKPLGRASTSTPVTARPKDPDLEALAQSLNQPGKSFVLQEEPEAKYRRENPSFLSTLFKKLPQSVQKAGSAIKKSFTDSANTEEVTQLGRNVKKFFAPPRNFDEAEYNPKYDIDENGKFTYNPYKTDLNKPEGNPLRGAGQVLTEIPITLGELVTDIPAYQSLAKKVTDTSVGRMVANAQEKLITKAKDFSTPKTIQEARDMRLADLGFNFVGNISASKSTIKAIAQSKDPEVIASLLKKEVPDLNDKSAEVLGKILTRVEKEKDVERVLNRINFAKSGRDAKNAETGIVNATPDSPNTVSLFNDAPTVTPQSQVPLGRLAVPGAVREAEAIARTGESQVPSRTDETQPTPLSPTSEVSNITPEGVKTPSIEGKGSDVPTQTPRTVQSLLSPKKAEATPTQYLPPDVRVEDEAKAVGAKRIAPDRVAHQQPTPEQAIERLVEQAKETATKNSQSWIKAVEKLNAIIDKYGDTIPPRNTREYGIFNGYKKYAIKPKNVVDMRDQFLARSERVAWNETKEQVYREQGAVKDYTELVKKDISKGYKYPDVVLNYDKAFKTAVDSRARYEKGLATSFSADDARIVFPDTELIGVGMKRQDGKELTQSQIDEIKEGVRDFSDILKIDMKRLAENDRWVYVHLNDKNPFLMKATAGLYRQGKDSVSISVGGRESFEKIVDGKKVKEYVNTTVAHELGHALDYKTSLKLFNRMFLYARARDYNPIEFSSRGSKYWQSNKEVTARMIEEYIAVSKGQTAIFDRQGYWKKEIFEKEIKPAVEKAIETHFAEYIKKADATIEQNLGKNDLVKVTDKTTGQSQERIVHKMLPDGSGVVTSDKVSGIPYKTLFEKNDVSLVKKGEVESPSFKVGDTLIDKDDGQKIVIEKLLPENKYVIKDNAGLPITVTEKYLKNNTEISDTANKSEPAVTEPVATKPAQISTKVAEPVLPKPPVTEEDSLAIAAEEYAGSEFALNASKFEDEQITFNLESTFADLKGVDLNDTNLKFTEQDLEYAKLNYEFAMESLLNDPARVLVKYISKTTGRLPEITGTDMIKSLTGNGKMVKNSEFGMKGDEIIDNAFGLKSDIRDAVSPEEAQSRLDAYIQRRDRVQELYKDLQNIRNNIRLSKQKDAFVGVEKKKLAREFAMNLDGMKKLVQAAERSGFRRGLETGSKKYETLVQRLKDRRGKLNGIKHAYNLTDAQMKKIRGTEDPRFMTKEEFDTYLDDVESKAKHEREKEVQKMLIDYVITEKDLKKTENLQRAMDLPPVKDMTLDQLKAFEKELSNTRAYDTFLGPRMIQTAVNTDLGNIRTIQDGIDKVVEQTGMPFLEPVEGRKLDRWRRDPTLIQRDPLHNLFITEWIAREADMLTRQHQLKSHITKLANASRKSRAQKNVTLRKEGKIKETFMHRLLSRASGDDVYVSRYIEASPETLNQHESVMTPEEIEFGKFGREFFQKIHTLVTEDAANRWTLRGVKYSRFKDMYFPHMTRNFLERWRDDGFVRAMKVLWETESTDTKIDFNAFGDRGQVLGYEKWFKNNMKREGAKHFSQNVANVMMAYSHSFDRKMLLDAMTPKIKLLEFLTAKRYKTPVSLENPTGAEQIHSQLTKSINEWVNNKKGQRIEFGLAQGDELEAVVNATSMFVSVIDLGGNLTTQFGSGVGGELFSLRGAGVKNWAIGHKRAFEKQGVELGQKYSGVIGESPWSELASATNNVGSNLISSMFFVFGDFAFRARRQMFLGLMTKEEYASGILTPKRQAEIKIQIGKWHMLPEFRSVGGSTTVAKAMGKYTEWAVPGFQTAVGDLKRLIAEMKRAKKGEAFDTLIHSDNFKETMHTILLGVGAYLVGQYVLQPDENDKSFYGQLRYKAAREAGSIIQSATGIGVFTSARMMGFSQDLMDAVKTLWTLERYKQNGPGYKEGDLKGVNAIQSVLMPNAIEQFLPEPETPIKTKEDVIKQLKGEYERGEITKEALSERLKKELASIKEQEQNRRFDLSKEEYVAEMKRLFTEGKITKAEIAKELPKYMKEKKKTAPESFESKNDADFIDKIVITAKAMGTDPVTAFQAIFTKEQIRRMDNGEIILHRAFSPDDEEQRKWSASERKKRGATEDLILEHMVPLAIGGDNSNSNLQLVTKDKHDEWTPVETFLGKLLQAEKIDPDVAQDLILRLKAGEITKEQLYAEATGS
jgi:hypothetical protein